jgi:hypothetical protein
VAGAFYKTLELMHHISDAPPNFLDPHPLPTTHTQTHMRTCQLGKGLRRCQHAGLCLLCLLCLSERIIPQQQRRWRRRIQ